MKNKTKKIGLAFGVVVLLVGARVSFSEPGSESDPLVTLSYVDTKITQLQYYIDSKLTGNNQGPDKESSWEVVEVSAGKSIIGKAGTEMILRSGRAKSISNISIVSENGTEYIVDNGLTDVTNGKDLTKGMDISTDHLLIVPRDDGRGVQCTADSFFLIKGNYRIE